MILGTHQVHFDIPYALTGLINGEAVINRDSIGDHVPRIASESSFTSSMPVTEALVQSLRVDELLVNMHTRPNILIKEFVATSQRPIS